MSGVAGAFLLPSGRSQRTVYDQLKHMVPKLENRGLGEVGVAAFVHEERLQHTKSCRPAGKLAGVDFTEQGHAFQAACSYSVSRSLSQREV